MNELTHVDNNGNARMVDVGNKSIQKRRAVAQGTIILQTKTIELIRENELKKGDVLTVSEIAGIQAAKQTSNLIPLCHPLRLTKVAVKAQLIDNGVSVSAEVQCNGQTGVEMEALTAVSIALMTIYDMCKAVDKTMVVSTIELVEKTKVDINL